MIFLDRSIPRSVADALKLVRTGDIACLEDHFPHDTKDEDWLPIAGANGWLVITRDKKIRSRPRQRQLIQEHAVGCFIIAQKRDLTRWEYLRLLARSLDDFERLHRATSRPYLFVVDAAGTPRPVRL